MDKMAKLVGLHRELLLIDSLESALLRVHLYIPMTRMFYRASDNIITARGSRVPGVLDMFVVGR